jgi:hypothetical protein
MRLRIVIVMVTVTLAVSCSSLPVHHSTLEFSDQSIPMMFTNSPVSGEGTPQSFISGYDNSEPWTDAYYGSAFHVTSTRPHSTNIYQPLKEQLGAIFTQNPQYLVISSLALETVLGNTTKYLLGLEIVVPKAK